MASRHRKPADSVPPPGFLTCRAAADPGIPGKGAEREPGAGSEAAGEPAETNAGANPQAAGRCGGLVGAARTGHPFWGALPRPDPASVAAALGPGPRRSAAAVRMKRRLRKSQELHVCSRQHITPQDFGSKASVGCISLLGLPTPAIPLHRLCCSSQWLCPHPVNPPKPREWVVLWVPPYLQLSASILPPAKNSQALV